MAVAVQVEDGQHRLVGDWGGVGLGNEFLAHLRARAFATATVRAYAFDVASFARFLAEQQIALSAVEPIDVFAWVDWQGARTPATNQRVVRLKPRSAAPATINRRVAAVRAFFEFLVMSGIRESNPVPAPRRGQGLRATSRGMLGHLGPGRGASAAADGWSASSADSPSHWTWRTCRRSCPGCAPIGTGRWCWPCCWADCARPRSAGCCSATSTRAVGGCG
jgi:hypothetical protein